MKLKIEIRSHYWPATPDLREIKVFIDDEEVRSSFMDQDEFWEFCLQFPEIERKLHFT